MQQRLLYVMDPLCSWCWGFAPVLDTICQEYPQLSLHLVAGGLRPAPGQPLDGSLRASLEEHWQAVAEASGQPFRQPQQLPAEFLYNTEPACRALVAARTLDPALSWPLVRRIQQAFYADLEDVTRPSRLVDLAAEVGYAAQSFAEHYDSEQASAALAADFSWVRDLGIAGFPTLLAQRNGQLALLANGYRPPSAVLELLQRWHAAGQAEC